MLQGSRQRGGIPIRSIESIAPSTARITAGSGSLAAPPLGGRNAGSVGPAAISVEAVKRIAAGVLRASEDRYAHWSG